MSMAKGGQDHTTSRRGGCAAWCAAVPALALLLLLQACASQHAHAPAAAIAAPPRPVRLAWLPLDALVAPDLAATINQRLGGLRVGGATESFRAPVSMEVAQLAIECIEPVAACYTAVGRSLGADRVLWAELAPHGEAGGGVRVALVLFDVSGGAVVRRAERSFADADQARAGVATLVSEAFERPAAKPAAAGAGAP
jgi:hypothetical protein